MTLLQSTLDGALKLASHGLYVVRLHYPIFDHQSKQVRCSCGRSECSAEGKHPVGAQWGKSATTDPDSIRDFWREADWNVGVLLGLGHGIQKTKRSSTSKTTPPKDGSWRMSCSGTARRSHGRQGSRSTAFTAGIRDCRRSPT